LFRFTEDQATPDNPILGSTVPYGAKGFFFNAPDGVSCAFDHVMPGTDATLNYLLLTPKAATGTAPGRINSIAL